MTNYQPISDSPFDEAYAAFLGGGFRPGEHSPVMLDEFVQIVRLKLDTPAYADDQGLARFAEELDPKLTATQQGFIYDTEPIDASEGFGYWPGEDAPPHRRAPTADPKRSHAPLNALTAAKRHQDRLTEANAAVAEERAARDAEVRASIAQGFTQHQVAAHLGISQNAVHKIIQGGTR